MASLDLRVGSLTAAPGQKVQSHLDVPGTALGVPVTLINGPKPGRMVVILSRVHGGEYPGIETAIRLAAGLRYVEVLPGPPEPPQREPLYLSQFGTTHAADQGCWYPSVAVGDTVKTGDRIGELRDVFSKRLRAYEADQDGVVLVLITSLAVGAGEPIFAIGSAGD